jgi:hypothetical protein
MMLDQPPLHTLQLTLRPRRGVSRWVACSECFLSGVLGALLVLGLIWIST